MEAGLFSRTPWWEPRSPPLQGSNWLKLRRVIALQIGVLGPHVLNRMCSWQRSLVAFGGRGAVLVGRVVKSCGGTVLLLFRPVLLGACQASFGPSSCLAVGQTVLWGQSWLHGVWGPCLVVGAQGETLKAWVVKLLGGLSASARAQRTVRFFVSVESPHSSMGISGSVCMVRSSSCLAARCTCRQTVLKAQ